MDGFGFLPDTRDFAQRSRAVKRFLGAVRNGVQREPGAAQRTALVRTASSKGMGPRARGMVARTVGGCGSGSNWMSGPAKQKSVGCGGGVAPSRAPADGFGFLDAGRAAVGGVRGQISSMRGRAMSTTKKSGCGCGGGCGGKTNGLGFLDSGSSQVAADVWDNTEGAVKCGCGRPCMPGSGCGCEPRTRESSEPNNANAILIQRGPTGQGQQHGPPASCYPECATLAFSKYGNCADAASLLRRIQAGESGLKLAYERSKALCEAYTQAYDQCCTKLCEDQGGLPPDHPLACLGYASQDVITCGWPVNREVTCYCEWDLSCVCQKTGNSPGLNCVRRCLDCRKRLGMDVGIPGHDECVAKCKRMGLWVEADDLSLRDAILNCMKCWSTINNPSPDCALLLELALKAAGLGESGRELSRKGCSYGKIPR